jgi:predicted acetyltransferase
MSLVILTRPDVHLTASARVIEKAGGVLEDVRETAIGPKRRYRISL